MELPRADIHYVCGELRGPDTTNDLAEFVMEAAEDLRPKVEFEDSEKAGMEDDIPGDTTTTAALTLGDVVDGVWETSGDDDWYAFTVEANDIGTFFADALSVLTIYDADGNALASADDDTIAFQFEDAGTYFISVFGSDDTYALTTNEIDDDYLDNTNTTGDIRLDSVTSGIINFDEDQDWFRFTLEEGTAIRFATRDEDEFFDEFFSFDFYDSEGNRIAGGEDIAVLSEIAPGDYFIGISYSDTFGSYNIRTTVIADDNSRGAESEVTMGPGETLSGTTDFEGDRDWFGFSTDGSETLTLTVDGDLGDVNIFDADGNFVRNGNSVVDTEGLAAGDYFAVVTGFYDPGYVNSYTLTLEGEVEDDYTDNIQSTGEVSVDAPATGTIEFEGDANWFQFSAVQGSNYRLEVSSGDAEVTGVFRTDGREDTSVDIVDGEAFLPSFGARFFIEVSGDTVGAEYTLIATPVGTDGRDDFRGTDGDDLFDALDGTDTIYGGAGNDVFVDGAGDDLNYGGEDNDAFISGEGADLFDGGAGRDRVLYSRSEAGVDVNLIDNSLNTGEATGDVLVDIEVVIGSAFDDVLVSGNGSLDLFGGAGDDLILGGKGDDVLRGDAGDDVFSVRADEGRDRVLDFTQGEDTILFTGGPGSIADLSITTNAAGTVVTSGIGAIVLLGFFDTLTEDDFRFRNPEESAAPMEAIDLALADLSAATLAKTAAGQQRDLSAMLMEVAEPAAEDADGVWSDDALDALLF